MKGITGRVTDTVLGANFTNLELIISANLTTIASMAKDSYFFPIKAAMKAILYAVFRMASEHLFHTHALALHLSLREFSLLKNIR
jgi:hypothetical protein